MFANMTPNLPRWLEPKPLSPKKLARCPSAQLERGLIEWETLRGNELRDPKSVNYSYYLDTAHEHNENAHHFFGIGEAVRVEIRAGADPDLPGIWHNNIEAHHVLESIGCTFGWRIIPYARWASRMLSDSSVARDVEQACRAWCAQADAVWLVLRRMPKSKLYRESHAALVAPLRAQARDLESRMINEFSRRPELRVGGNC